MGKSYVYGLSVDIRKYIPSDCEHLAELFYRTVHTINAVDYTQEQLNVWATGRVNLVMLRLRRNCSLNIEDIE